MRNPEIQGKHYGLPREGARAAQRRAERMRPVVANHEPVRPEDEDKRYLYETKYPPFKDRKKGVRQRDFDDIL